MSVTLPYADACSAAAGLRAELRHRLAGADDEAPDWENLVVHGPMLSADARGHVWFEYSAVVHSRPMAAAAVPGG